MRNIIRYIYPSLFLAFMLIHLACNTHYGHRSKVRVSRQEKANGPTKHITHNATIEANNEEYPLSITASADTLVQFTTKNDYSSKLQSKPQKELGSNEEKVKNVKRKDVVRHKKPPMNFYAKWALIIGLISLLGLFAMVPAALAPVTLHLGRKSLKEIRKSGERGKSAAITAIVIGAILFSIIFISFWPILFTNLEIGWLLLVTLLYLLIFLLNLLVYNAIKRSSRNPARKNSPERPYKKQKIGLKIFLIALLTLMISINIVVLIFLRGASVG